MTSRIVCAPQHRQGGGEAWTEAILQLWKAITEFVHIHLSAICKCQKLLEWHCSGTIFRTRTLTHTRLDTILRRNDEKADKVAVTFRFAHNVVHFKMLLRFDDY